jgi:uracil-DNA glycosylase family 4
MRELQNIYSGLKPGCSNELCEGCTILTQSKPEYAYMDYEKLSEGPILFLSDSLKSRYGKLEPFSKKERELIQGIYPDKVQFAASVKCPSVKEGDMTPDNMKLCREHLDATIEKVKPRLVFACGNLAMKMLIKKSGITNKRGSSYVFESNSGHSCIVVPVYHPYAVLKEPRHRYLFETDIKNAYEKYVLGKTNAGNFRFSTETEIEGVEAVAEKLSTTTETIAVDIETTGLNFRTDIIQTIAIATEENTYVIPLDHKDSPFRSGETHALTVWALLKNILENPNNRKVFHNAKFDLKFLINYGIHVTNVWDTKIMHHFINETAPKSLMDLVKLYFADELENL